MRQKLSEIFDLFDANGNGKISADEIELDLVSADILAIFKPLLVEMETFDEDLDKDEFIESSLTLLDKMDINIKNQVLSHGRKTCAKSVSYFERDNKFKPEISKMSKKLVHEDAKRKLAPEKRFKMQQELKD